MPGFAPETATSPLAEAPPDRPTADLEMLLRQVTALIFGDRVMDKNEQTVFRGFMEEVSMRAQSGGIGQGGTPSPEAAQQQQMSPMEMNADQAEDFGDGQGEPMNDQGY